MSSLAEYIDWYSDFTFYEKPFNEVDNLVLCMLTYYDYDLNSKSGDRTATLRRCLKNDHESDDFIKAAYNSVRFGRLVISDFTDVFDKKASVQFAAMTFRLTDSLYYIAFRGTDDSLVGWREDFMMSYTKTPAQQEALDYLERVIDDSSEYYVGGHSKGGNLALYGCCNLSEKKLSRVKHIYNNDGPGLCPEVSDVSLIDRIRLRTTVIMPSYCVFGKIFPHDFPDKKIVKSSYKNIEQHDIMSWQVDRGKLDRAPDFEPSSLWINEVADKWLDVVTAEERERLVNSIFDTVEKHGAETRQQILDGGVDEVEDLLVNMVETDSIKTAAKIPERFVFGDFMDRLRTGKLSKFIKANELIEGIVFLVIGILMLIFPQGALQIIAVAALGALVVFQLIHTLRKLYESNWNFSRERTRVYIFLIITTIFALVLVKDQALFVVGSGLAGGCLLVIAYRSFLQVKDSPVRDFAYIKNALKALLYFICGIMVLVTPLQTLKWFMLALGVIMVIDGICTIVYSFIQANERYARKYSDIRDKVIRKNK